MFVINWVLKAVNIFCAVGLAAAFFCSRFPPGSLPYVSTVGLLVPFLIIVNILFAVLWAVRLKPFVLYSVLALAAGWGQLGSFFAFGSAERPAEGADTLRVVSYNVHGFSYAAAENGGQAEKIRREIVKYAPDVVCFQEYRRGRIELPGLPYSFVKDHGWFVDAVFSRYPIVATGSLDFPGTQNNAVYADLRLPAGRIVRVYSVHLQSLGISADEVNELASLPSEQIKDRAVGLIGRVNAGFVRQQSQAEALRASIDGCRHPCVVAGDFNNTSFSYSFRRIAGEDLQDAFSRAGSGFGRTFRAIRLYPLRIDFILADREAFRVNAFSTLRSDASDHNGITALLSFREKDQDAAAAKGK